MVKSGEQKGHYARQGSFSVGRSVRFADGLRTMLAQLAVERPRLRCAMATGLSAVLADKLAQGELEAAILLGTQTPRSEILGRAWPGSDRHCPILGSGCRWWR